MGTDRIIMQPAIMQVLLYFNLYDKLNTKNHDWKIGRDSANEIT